MDQDLDKDGVIGIDEVIAGTDPNNPPPNGVIDIPVTDVTIKAGQRVNFGVGVTNSDLEDPGAVIFGTPGTFTVIFTGTDSFGLPDPSPDRRVITVQETSAPTAKIIFPPAIFLTDAPQITVKGTATDESGVSSVLVNDIAATTSDGFANWQAVVPLSNGENTLIVKTRDTLGNINANTASARTKRQLSLASPKGLTLYSTKNRVLLIDEVSGTLMAVDLTTGNRSILSGASRGTGPSLIGSAGIALDTVKNQALVTNLSIAWLIAVDLATGNRTMLSSQFTGTGLKMPRPADITLDAERNRALVVDGIMNALFAVDLTTGNRSILSDSSIGSGPAFISPHHIALDVVKNRALVIDNTLDALIAVDLDTGNRTILSNASTGIGTVFLNPINIALDEKNNRMLVINKNARMLVAVDLATGNRTILSGGSPLVGTGTTFIALNRVTLDEANNRALVTDLGNQDRGDTIISVDLSTGDRTRLSGVTTGTGPAFSRFGLNGVVLDEPNNQALVIDSTLDALFVVDLENGERVIISR